MGDLKKYIKEANLVFPDYNNLNIIDLMETIYARFGYETNNSAKKNYLNKLIPNNIHYLFVISDGTGINLFDKLDNYSILKNNLKGELLTVFPSTTGCVLTSIVTAKYPETHGIWGWFNYNRGLDQNYYPLLFADRKSEKSLTDFNIKLEDIFKEKSVLNNLEIDVNVLFPDYICNSIYSKFVGNDNIRYSYGNYKDIEEKMKKVCEKDKTSFTYLYLPDVDSIEHETGIDSHETIDKLKEIDALIKNLSNNKNLTIILTADHGQINVNEGIILNLKKYNKYFYAYPSIDFKTVSYYIKKDLEEEFVKNFNKDFESKMYLFKTKDFFDNNMFGIGNVSEYAKSNLGEYISLCENDKYLINTEDVELYYGKIKGCHSGLTKDEMIIPLVIIDSNEYNN